MGRARRNYGEDEVCIQGSFWETLGKRPLGIPRRIILNGIQDWIELAENRDRWRALVNATMNIRVTQYTSNFLTS